MSERKVINKYYPPDYDPAKPVKVRKGKGSGISGGGGSHGGKQTVRLMTPFSMRCSTCGEYIYKGKKFNARKEETSERYFSIKIFRFHIRCTRCSSSITFKTDPRNADFTAESGATRSVEPLRAPKAADGDDETELDKLAEEEEATAMEQLEVKTVDARREMEIADALDEIRMRNAKAGRIDPDALLKKLAMDKAKEEAAMAARLPNRAEAGEEDRALAKQVFATEQGDAPIRRLREDEEAAAAVPALAAPVIKPMPLIKKRERGSLLGVKLAKKTKLV